MRSPLGKRHYCPPPPKEPLLHHPRTRAADTPEPVHTTNPRAMTAPLLPVLCDLAPGPLCSPVLRTSALHPGLGHQIQHHCGLASTPDARAVTSQCAPGSRPQLHGCFASKHPFLKHQSRSLHASQCPRCQSCYWPQVPVAPKYQTSVSSPL